MFACPVFAGPVFAGPVFAGTVLAGTVTTRLPSLAGRTRGVRMPASARSASIQASSDSIAGREW